MSKAGKILKKFLKRKQKTNPAYSMRALARDLQLSPTFMSRVLSGEKRLAYRDLEKVAGVLDMDHETLMDLKRSYVPDDIAALSAKASAPLTDNYEFGSQGDFQVLRLWYYVAIIDLTMCADFGGGEEEIAKRLGLHLETTRVAVQELLSGGFLKRSKGRLVKSESRLRLTSAKSRGVIREFHNQMLERARLELRKNDQASFDLREISGITIAADMKKLKNAKKMLIEKLHEIAEYLNDGETTEVYHLAAQLFPLSKR